MYVNSWETNLSTLVNNVEKKVSSINYAEVQILSSTDMSLKTITNF